MWAIEILRLAMMSNESFVDEYRRDISSVVCLPEDAPPFDAMAFRETVGSACRNYKLHEFSVELSILTDHRYKLVELISMPNSSIDRSFKSVWTVVSFAKLSELKSLLKQYVVKIDDDDTVENLYEAIRKLSVVNNVSVQKLCEKIIRMSRLPMNNILIEFLMSSSSSQVLSTT